MPPKRNKKKKQREENIVYKPCPGCGASTVKTGGCNYIKCKNPMISNKCGTEWCFYAVLKKEESTVVMK